MSEFSESYHFRANASHDEATLAAALTDAGLAGVLFAPKGKWRTFVPFESDDAPTEPDSVSARLSRAVQDTVIAYWYIDDAYWAFLVRDGETIGSAYTCSWTRRAVTIDASELRVDRLRPLLEPGHSTEHLRELLTPTKPTREVQRKAAGIFANALGLSRFEWLGPRTIEIDLDEIQAELAHTVIGAPRPSRSSGQPLWTRVPLTLESEALTAFDVLAIVRPHALAWAPDAMLACCDSNVARVVHPTRPLTEFRFELGPWIDEHGRTAPHGGFVGYFASVAKQQCLIAALLVDERALWTMVLDMPLKAVHPAPPSHWLDSSAIIAIAEPHYRSHRTSDMPPLFERFMSLDPAADTPLWYVTYISADRTSAVSSVRFEIGAVDGELRATRVVRR